MVQAGGILLPQLTNHLWIVINSCLVIIVCAIGVYFHFRAQILPIAKELAKWGGRLRLFDGEEGFTNNYSEFDEGIKETTYLNNSWQEFSEVLLMPGTDFEDGENIRNTKQPHLYFSQRTILWHRLNMRFYNAFPNFLTGAGILGTFIGLVWGISQATSGLTGDIEHSKAALQTLLHGAAFAFSTSIAGLLSSIIFSWREKALVHKFDRFLSAFNEELEKRLEFISTEKIVSATLLEAKKQTASLESFSNDLAISLAEILEQRITTPFNAAMGAALTESKRQTESLNQLPDTFGDLLEERVTTPMNETMGGLQNVMEGVREDQKRANDETLERLITEFGKTITGAAGKEMDAFASTMDTLSSDLQKQMDAMTQNHREMQNASQQAIQNANEAFAEGSRNIRDDIGFTISSMLDGVNESTSQMMAMLRDATGESANNMKNVATQFEGAATILQKTMDGMANVSERSQTLMADINTLLKSVQATQENLSVSVDPIAQAAQDMKNTSENFIGTSAAMTEAGEGLNQSVATLREIQDDMQEAWVSYTERFENVDQSLSMVFGQFKLGFESYAKSTSDYVQELDKNASKVVSSLAGATHEFDESIHEFDERIQNLSDALNQEGIGQFVNVTENLKQYIGELDNYASHASDSFAIATKELGDRIHDLDQVLSKANLISLSNATDNLMEYTAKFDANAKSDIERLVGAADRLGGQMKEYSQTIVRSGEQLHSAANLPPLSTDEISNSDHSHGTQP